MLAPRLLVVVGLLRERLHDRLEVVGILVTNVLLDQFETRALRRFIRFRSHAFSLFGGFPLRYCDPTNFPEKSSSSTHGSRNGYGRWPSEFPRMSLLSDSVNRG